MVFANVVTCLLYIISKIVIGSPGGLTLFLNVEQYEYISTKENYAAGFKVSIQDQSIAGILMEANAGLVPPGALTKLAIHQTDVCINK